MSNKNNEKELDELIMSRLPDKQREEYPTLPEQVKELLRIFVVLPEHEQHILYARMLEECAIGK